MLAGMGNLKRERVKVGATRQAKPKLRRPKARALMARAELLGIGFGSWSDMALGPTRGSMGDDLAIDWDIVVVTGG
jgi:hypothetical protein